MSYSPEQVPVPSLGEIGNFTLAEAPFFSSFATWPTRWPPWSRKWRSSTSRQATLRPGLTTPYPMLRTTLSYWTRSSLVYMICHIGWHSLPAQIIPPPPAQKACPRPATGAAPPVQTAKGAPPEPPRVRHHYLQRSWEAQATLTKRPAKNWPAWRTIGVRKIRPANQQHKSRNPVGRPLLRRPLVPLRALQEDCSPHTRTWYSILMLLTSKPTYPIWPLQYFEKPTPPSPVLFPVPLESLSTIKVQSPLLLWTHRFQQLHMPHTPN